jgi:two-component system LytT family response regulator
MRAVIIDDEELARAKLARMLAFSGVEIVGEAGDALSGAGLVAEVVPDVVFLDIDMPGGSGLELAGQLIEPGKPHVVFVTAHAEHAVEAFELEAIDYLLKPVSRARLAQCVQRLERKRSDASEQEGEAEGEGTELPGASFISRVLVKSGARMQFLHLDEVRWIESADNYVRLHARSGTFLIRTKLAELEQKLDPAKFIRIHRCTIVNLDAIKEFEPWTSGELIVVLHDKTKLKLSRTHRYRLRALTGAVA